MDLSIRKCVPSDLAFVSALGGEFAGKHLAGHRKLDPEAVCRYRRRQLSSYGSAPPDPQHDSLIVAEREGTPVGYALIRKVVEPTTGLDQVLIEDLIVEESERRRGAGSALLKAVEDKAAEWNVGFLAVAIPIGIEDSLAFLEKRGFWPERNRYVRPAVSRVPEPRSLVLRRGTREDYPVLREHFEKSIPHSLHPKREITPETATARCLAILDQARDSLYHDDVFYMFAIEETGLQAGSLIGIILKDEHTGTPQTYLLNVFTSPECRKQRVATVLSDALDLFTVRKGIPFVSSEVTLTNTPSLHYARTIGFTEERLVLAKVLCR
ncbi:MAG: GNAT family N-acetyltransferase [Armatimonadetes bacterium]|nr:GNAT family N-acetyltransferase [Armatimonadota bacterium]